MIEMFNFPRSGEIEFDPPPLSPWEGESGESG